MAKIYYLPTVAAIAAVSFTPTGHAFPKEPIIAVEYVSYGIIGGLQITSLAEAAVTIREVFINNEFSTSLHAPQEEGRESLLSRGFPRLLPKFGDSFITITDAPGAPDAIRALCYGKPVTDVLVSTSLGDLAFKIGDDLADHW